MVDLKWNPDAFRSEVLSQLTVTLAGKRDTAALAAAVAGSAAAAEAICAGRPMACTAGCPHCCVLNVAVLLPEAMIIAERIRERLSPPELAALQKQLRLHRCWVRWMDDEERILKHESCPLLDAAGSCTVHPVRPLACRGITSLDSQSCREAFAPSIVNDEMLTIPADLLRKSAYDEAFLALAQALKLYGLDDRSIELGSGVLAFMECPERRELFLSGARLPQEIWQ
jgi:Fe-S-cluster containining protein